MLFQRFFLFSERFFRRHFSKSATKARQSRIKPSSRALIEPFVISADTLLLLEVSSRKESEMAKPAARLSDPTACPLPGHGTNPIATGSSDVFFDGLSAARQTDKSACGSTLAGSLSATVLINGLNAATIGSTGSHGNTVTAGSGTVIIGSSHTPAPFTPLLPLPFQKVYGQSFSISDSETGKPLALREFVATVDGVQIPGVTDADGIAHVKTPSPDAKISLHIKFVAPVRTLHELSEGR